MNLEIQLIHVIKKYTDMKKILFITMMSIMLSSYTKSDKKKVLFNYNTECHQILHLNALELNLCSNNSITLDSLQITQGIGSMFKNTFYKVDNTSFEDTEGSLHSYGFDEVSNGLHNGVFFTIFYDANNNYWYGFNIKSNEIVFKYNNGIEIKVGDSLNKISNEFSNLGFNYDLHKKSATLNIINQAYLTFYFDDDKHLKSISLYNHLI